MKAVLKIVHVANLTAIVQRREGGFDRRSNDDNRGNRVDYKPAREGYGDRPKTFILVKIVHVVKFNGDRPQRSFGDDRPKRFGDDRPKRFGDDKPRGERTFGEDRPRRKFND